MMEYIKDNSILIVPSSLKESIIKDIRNKNKELNDKKQYMMIKYFDKIK